MLDEVVSRIRFSADRELLQSLLALPAVQQSLGASAALRARDDRRATLLASAVRVGPRTLPALHQALGRVAERLGSALAFEAYVFPDAALRAYVAQPGPTTIVALSSAALGLLRGPELEFLLGHELGHLLLDHAAFPDGQLLHSGVLAPLQQMRLRAWQRAAEISADRAGLCACGSFESAAAAVFKTLSGVDAPREAWDPAELVTQWDDLRREVSVLGERTHWELTHPFMPLRMRAMQLYAEAAQAAGEALSAFPALSAADPAIAAMLALMEPETEGAAAPGQPDPLLAEFFFWGGLYVALADGSVGDAECQRLQAVAPPGVSVARALAAPDFRAERCRERFRDDLRARRRKLSAVELHRIVQGLIDVASADGHVDEHERERICELAQLLGISREGSQLVLARALERRTG